MVGIKESLTRSDELLGAKDSTFAPAKDFYWANPATSAQPDRACSQRAAARTAKPPHFDDRPNLFRHCQCKGPPLASQRACDWLLRCSRGCACTLIKAARARLERFIVYHTNNSSRSFVSEEGWALSDLRIFGRPQDQAAKASSRRPTSTCSHGIGQLERAQPARVRGGGDDQTARVLFFLGEGESHSQVFEKTLSRALDH
jgi:hypothetical protein